MTSVFKAAATVGTVLFLGGLFVIAAAGGFTRVAGGGFFTEFPWWAGPILIVAGIIFVYGGAQYSLRTSGG